MMTEPGEPRPLAATVIRIDGQVYEALLEVVHELEREEGRRVSMNEALRHVLERERGK